MIDHIAIVHARYAKLILEDVKTVECRLTKTALPPYRKIKKGERIYFKQACGPYRVLATAGAIEFHDKLTPRQVDRLRKRFNPTVCGDDAYWAEKRTSRYATFIELCKVKPIDAGPQLEPSRGLAWFTMIADNRRRSADRHQDRAHHQRTCPSMARVPYVQHVQNDPVSQPENADSANALSIVLTAGAIRNRYLRLPPRTRRHSLTPRNPRNSEKLNVKSSRTKHDPQAPTPPVNLFFPESAYGGRSVEDAGLPVTLILPDGREVRTDISDRRMFRWRGWGSYFKDHKMKPGDLVQIIRDDPLRYQIRFVRL